MIHNELSLGEATLVCIDGKIKTNLNLKALNVVKIVSVQNHVIIINVILYIWICF